MNDALRHALAEARLREIDVATALGVDPKTVQRWLAGRVPHPRHRWAVADLLRHRSLSSTRVYAKVDLPALSTVAMPWP